MKYIIIVIMFFSVLQAKFIVNKDNSNFQWIGRKLSGEHDGGIQMSSIDFNVYKKTDGSISISGYMSIDMNSITNSDIESMSSRQYLVGHLKNNDFFDVINYPYSYIEIIDCVKLDNSNRNIEYNYLVKGEITIKGISKKIEFPILLEYDTLSTDKITAIGTISIDRTDFGIKYKSKSYFPTIGDRFIYDKFIINFRVNGEIN